MKRNHTFD